jgi:hypothetical protein
MAEPERTTSFAKSVEGLHKEESALDRARALRDQFAHAQEQNNQKQKPREAERPQGETEKSGSPMIRNDRPAPHLTPSGPMRSGPDRYASATKLGKEHDTADAKAEAARKALETFRARQGQSRDHERDRER